MSVNTVPCSYVFTVYRCRADEIVFFVGILAPFLITYTFNVIIYFIIVGSLCRQVLKRKDMLNKEMLHVEYKRLAIVAFFLAIMFGLAWIFAILVVIPNTVASAVFQYLFSFFVGFQGLLYFIMHGMRSPDARRFWITLIYKPCPSRMPKFLKTWTTTTPYHQTKQPHVVSKQNPLYTSQDNLLSSPGESTFNTLQRPTDTTDIGASPSSYSLASQTVQIDFTLPTIISDDEVSSMDMLELTDIINTKFSDPNAPGVAVSPPRIPISSAHENSPLTKQSSKVSAVEKEFKLTLQHVVKNEAADTLELAYDSMNPDYDSSAEEN